VVTLDYEAKYPSINRAGAEIIRLSRSKTLPTVLSKRTYMLCVPYRLLAYVVLDISLSEILEHELAGSITSDPFRSRLVCHLSGNEVAADEQTAVNASHV
jgi:hypothetical protein